MALNSGSVQAPGTIRRAIDGSVATVWLDHPGRLNSLTIAMWQALAAEFAELSARDALRCIVIRGANGNFAAGADIREFPQARDGLDSVMHYHRRVIAPALSAIAACPHPVVAAIEGVCVGGGLEVASRCDLRIAARGARFGAPINRLGFPMAPEEMQGLLELAGRAVALEILLEGRVFDADEALAKGLLTRVHETADFEPGLADCVRRITAGAPLAARLNKRIARQLSQSDPATWPETTWRSFFSYADSADHRRGVQAFLAGQEPVFTGD